MIRTLPVFKATIARAALALAATGLLAGCITGDYAYRNGARGDYYYGQPSVDYRYQGYGGYGGYGYYPYGEAYRHRSRYGYGYPYGGYPYYGGHYGYPYQNPYHYPYRPRPPVVIRPPRPDGSVPPPQHRPDGRPPWRNLDELRRRQQRADGGNAQQQRIQVPARPAVVEPRRDSGSRLDQVIRRSSEARRPRESDERHER